MSSTWLTSVANLLVFFRWTTVWLNVVLLSLSLIPFTIVYITIFGVTGVVAIYNITVCIVQSKEKKRSNNGTLPVPALAVIIFDYLITILYIAAWVVSAFFTSSSYYWDGSFGYGNWYRYIFQSYTAIGCLVAAHYHFFYAVVNTHIRRRQAQGLVIPIGGVYAVADTKLAELGAIEITTTKEPVNKRA